MLLCILYTRYSFTKQLQRLASGWGLSASKWSSKVPNVLFSGHCKFNLSWNQATQHPPFGNLGSRITCKNALTLQMSEILIKRNMYTNAFICITPCFASVSLRCYWPTADLRCHRRDSAAWHGWSQVLAGSLTFTGIPYQTYDNPALFSLLELHELWAGFSCWTFPGFGKV